MGNIGVNVREVEAQGSSVLSPAPLYNIGVFVKVPKGVVGKAVLINSLESFRTAFGGADPSYTAYYMMKGLFQNSGQQKPNVYVIREYDTASPGVASSYQIGSGLNYFKLAAGYYGDDSPGTWGNNIRVVLNQGSLDSTWFLSIYEEKEGVLQLVETTSEFSKEEMVDTVNTYSKWVKCELYGDINAITLVADVPQFKSWEVTYGELDLLAVVVGDTVTGLTGYNTLSLTLTVGGSDVVVTMSEAELLSQISVSDLIDDSGVKLPASKVAEVFTNYINSYSTAASPIVADYQGGVLIDITTLYPGVDLSLIEDSGNSEFDPITDVTSSITTPSTGYNSFTSGTDPGVPSSSQLFTTQAEFFSGKQLQYVMSFNRFDLSWASGLNTWCTNKGDVLGIFQADKTEIPSGTFGTYASLLVDHSYIVGYFNWGYVEKESEFGSMLIPSLAHIFGAYYVRRKESFGGYAHIAPGGVDSSVLGFTELQWLDELSPETITLIARKYGFNSLRFTPGYGYVVESSRTMSTRNKFYSAHIRVSKNFIIQTVRNQMKIYQQRPNSPTTRVSLRDTIRIFAGKRFDEGMFEQEGGFENNVLIKCDEENNDLPVRKNRQLVLDMSMNFVEIAEEVNLNIIQLDGGLTVTES